MSEMLDRVARALCELDKSRAESAALAPPWRVLGYETRAEWIEASWPDYVNNARAAVEAMREPTEDMIRATIPSWEGGASPEVPWKIMIDAALA